MAKKQNKKVEVKKPQIEASNDINEVVIENVKVEKKEIKPEWEIKDRIYILSRNKSPLSATIKSSNIFYFDEKLGYEREMKYTINQKTPFVDEFVGVSRVAHIVFENGALFVPKEKQTLQKLLSLYHPDKGLVYNEFDSVKRAVDEVSLLELEIESLMVAQQMDIEMAEAIMRVELGSKVSNMSSKELKRDLLLFAKKNPSLFLELANDENVHLRNIGIKATEMNILSLSKDNRAFSWASNNRKLMTVPFDEHPYSALAAWFKTDEGMEVFGSIEKRLK